MKRIFVALVISYVLVVSAAMVAGLLVGDARSFAVHFSLGLFATLYTCALYCIVLTYFVITGKMVKQAVLLGNLDPGLIAQSQRPKVRVVRLTAVAVLLTLGAALLGAGANVAGDDTNQPQTLHLVAEVLAVSFNLMSFFLIYQSIDTHARRVSEVFEEYNRRHGPAQTAMG